MAARCDAYDIIELIMFRCNVGRCRKCAHNNICVLAYHLKVDWFMFYTDGEAP